MFTSATLQRWPHSRGHTTMRKTDEAQEAYFNCSLFSVSTKYQCVFVVGTGLGWAVLGNWPTVGYKVVMQLWWLVMAHVCCMLSIQMFQMLMSESEKGKTIKIEYLPPCKQKRIYIYIYVLGSQMYLHLCSMCLCLGCICTVCCFGKYWSSFSNSIYFGNTQTGWSSSNRLQSKFSWPRPSTQASTQWGEYGCGDQL